MKKKRPLRKRKTQGKNELKSMSESAAENLSLAEGSMGRRKTDLLVNKSKGKWILAKNEQKQRKCHISSFLKTTNCAHFRVIKG